MKLRRRLFRRPRIPGPGSRTQITDRRVGPRSRAQVVGRPSRHDDRRDHRRARFTFKHLKLFTWCFCLDRVTTKRQNSLDTVNSSTGPSFGNGSERKRSFFRFEREFRRFVISIARRVNSVNSLA